MKNNSVGMRFRTEKELNDYMQGKVPKRADKDKVLQRLRKRYDQTRALRDDSIDTVQRFRFELAKYTFADLDSKGKNPYFTNIKRRERKFKRRFYVLDKRLNELDNKIDNILMGK